MKFILASDHGGYELKQKIKEFLELNNYDYEDLGCNGENSSYAEYGEKLARKISISKNSLGIGICGTGLGISFAVNRVKGIRGARITSIEDAELAKIHNNANVLLFGGRQQSDTEVIEMIKTFLKNKFEGGRHNSRIEELDK